MGQQHESYRNALILQSHLKENIGDIRIRSDDENQHTDRAWINNH